MNDAELSSSQVPDSDDAPLAQRRQPTTRRTRNDGVVSDNVIEGSRVRKKTAKQAETEDETNTHLRQQLEMWKKKYKKVKHLTGKAVAEGEGSKASGDQDSDGDGFESEEETGAPSYQSSFTSKGVVSDKPRLPRMSAQRPTNITSTSQASSERRSPGPGSRSVEPPLSMSPRPNTLPDSSRLPDATRARSVSSRASSPPLSDSTDSGKLEPTRVNRDSHTGASRRTGLPRVDSFEELATIPSNPRHARQHANNDDTNGASLTRAPVAADLRAYQNIDEHDRGTVDPLPMPQTSRRERDVSHETDRGSAHHSSAHTASQHGSGSTSSRARRASRSPNPERRKRRRVRSRSPSPEAEAVIFKDNTTNPPTRGHPQASDYSKPIEGLINQAVQRVTLKLYTVNAFPSPLEKSEWAQETWEIVCRKAGKRFLADANGRIHAAIVRRIPSVRTYARAIALAKVASHYGISIDATKDTVKAANAALITSLMSGTPRRFSYKDFHDASPQRYAEDPLLLQILQRALFKDDRDIGAQFRAAFDPVPFPVLAFLLTCVEYSLDAWASGELTETHEFRTKEYREKYELHRSHLEDWEKINPTVVLKLRRRMFTRTLQMGKISSTATATGKQISEQQKEHLKAGLEARTGDTDSE